MEREEKKVISTGRFDMLAKAIIVASAIGFALLVMAISEVLDNYFMRRKKK